MNIELEDFNNDVTQAEENFSNGDADAAKTSQEAAENGDVKTRPSNDENGKAPLDIKAVQLSFGDDQQGYYAWEANEIIKGRLDLDLNDLHLQAVAAENECFVTSPDCTDKQLPF